MLCVAVRRCFVHTTGNHIFKGAGTNIHVHCEENWISGEILVITKESWDNVELTIKYRGFI